MDADGLVALSEIENWPALLGPNVVLTPHSGELERLVGHALSPDEPLWVHAGRLAQQWGVVLLAKGPDISADDGGLVLRDLIRTAAPTGHHAPACQMTLYELKISGVRADVPD